MSEVTLQQLNLVTGDVLTQEIFTTIDNNIEIIETEINKNLTASAISKNMVSVETTDVLNDSLSLNKNLLLLNGIHTLPSNLTSISNNIVIEGEKNVIIDGNGKYSISISNGLSNVEFKNLTFENLTGFTIKQGVNITFTKCNFKNFVAYGTIFENFNNIKFYNCTFDTIGTNVTYVTYQGCGIYANVGDKLIIEKSKFTNIYGQSAIFNIAVTNLCIEKNEIYNTFHRGIHFYFGISTGIIIDNDIYNCGSINTTGSGIGCNGIYSMGNTYGVSIINNRIKNVMENGIEGNFGVIDNNTIDGTGIDLIGHPTPSIEGIWLNPISDGVVYCRRNKIKNSAGCGIKHYSSGDISKLSIIGNIVEDESFNSTSNGIEIKSDTNYSNITIADNIVKNKLSTIFINNKPCTEVYVSNNKSINSGLPLPNANQIITNDGVLANIISNKDFSTWTSSTSLSNWTASNCNISQVVDNNSYVPKITTASGGYNGRLIQDIVLPKANKFYSIKIAFKGNDNLTVKVTPYLIDGITLDNTNAISRSSNSYSETILTEVTLVLKTSASKVQLYLGTATTTQNNYITIYSINDKLII